jgi:hypothetical protein
MKKRDTRFVRALIFGCLACVTSGFSTTHDVRARSRQGSASPHHVPSPRREQVERAIVTRSSISALHASKDPIDAPISASRRQWLLSSFTTSAAASAALAWTSHPTPARAAEAKTTEKGGVVGNPFDAIRYEVGDPKGGVAYLRDRLDARDFSAVMDFTKEYDLVLRKIAMGTAKKRLPKGPIKDRGTELCNAVTFDLIGINRNSRKGQENPDEARRYLDELVQDAKGMLELEKYAEDPPSS